MNTSLILVPGLFTPGTKKHPFLPHDTISPDMSIQAQYRDISEVSATKTGLFGRFSGLFFLYFRKYGPDWQTNRF
jgi:hypothetical protein